MLTFFFTDSKVVNRATICGLSAHAIKEYVALSVAGPQATQQHSEAEQWAYPATRVDITNPASCLDKALFKLPVRWRNSRLRPRHTLPDEYL